MRVDGLVRFFNHVRSQLQAGLTPDEVEPFKQQVKKIVGDVEAICRRHGAEIERLPAPSRRAYVFLRDLDLYNPPQARRPRASAGWRQRGLAKTPKTGAKAASLRRRRPVSGSRTSSRRASISPTDSGVS